MDIEILLMLQELRESLGSGLETAFAALSDTGGSIAVLALCFFVYWAVDKRTGIFVLMCFNVGTFINQFLKNLACVYRPWVRDPRIVPAPSALGGATGYSFPSGHTVSATTIFGSFAVRLWNARRWLSVIFIVLVAITGFSRLFLGVHTPQDVLAGIIEGGIVIAIGVKLAAWLHEHREKDWVFAVLALVLGFCMLVIIQVKPYPVDYVDGVLLVDPILMQRDCYEAAGLFCGAWLGWFCERRWVNFKTDGAQYTERAIRVLCGFVLVLIIMLCLDPLLKATVGLNVAKLVSRILLMFGAIFVGPWIAKAIAARVC